MRKEKPVYRALKRAQDIFFSLLALIVLSPLMLIVALAIVIDDPKGSPIFTQVRSGIDGKEFRIHKFRSMCVDCKTRLAAAKGEKEWNINDAIKEAQELLENGYVTGRPYLGISYYAVTDAQTAAQLGVNAYGVYIVEVVKGGPADKAGLQAGDRIVSVDGSEVATQSDLGTLMQNHKAGDTIEITVARGGQMQTVNVTLGEKGAENS